MSKFKRRSRYNDDLAKNGVWFSVRNEMGEHYGDFLCSLIDGHSPHFKLRAMRLPKINSDAPLSPEQIARRDAQTIVDLSLNDWRGVVDADGNEVAFSAADAVEYLAEETYVAERLMDHARNVANYQMATTADIVKN